MIKPIRTRVVYSACFLISFLSEGCIASKQKELETTIYGLYINTGSIEDGMFNEYILIDNSHKAYYLFDSIDYCKTDQNKIKENFRQQGDIHIKGDSIKFDFDSCLFTTSKGYVYIHGQNIEIQQRTFRNNYRQKYAGRISENKILFSIMTIDARNDTSYKQASYIKCGDSLSK